MRISVLAALVVGVLVPCATASTTTQKRDLGDARTVSYLFKAQLQTLVYQLDWVDKQGGRGEACSNWSVDRGFTRVQARTAAVLKNQSNAMPGQISLYSQLQEDRQSGRWNWADGNGVGGMTVTVKRGLTHEGGRTPCGDEPAQEDPFPSTDCGVRRYKVAAAVITPSIAKDLLFLEDLQDVSGRQKDRLILAVSALPRASPPLYRRCETTLSAPEFSNALPVHVNVGDWEALRKLRPGERHLIGSLLEGPCKRDLDANVTCRYAIGARIEIQRWKPGTKFP